VRHRARLYLLVFPIPNKSLFIRTHFAVKLSGVVKASALISDKNVMVAFHIIAAAGPPAAGAAQNPTLL
jgi:hypothetical protein